MRLFIAINFDDETKDKIVQVQNKLKAYARGSFTDCNNVHLTLVFLGEVLPSNLETVKRTIAKIRIPKTEITFNNIGYFKRNGGDIWWVGLNRNDKLISLQKQLTSVLINSGFKLEQRPYKPHITIARGVKLHEKIDKNTIMSSSFSTNVDSISLMLSNRVNEKLTYTELFRLTA